MLQKQEIKITIFIEILHRHYTLTGQDAYFEIKKDRIFWFFQKTLA